MRRLVLVSALVVVAFAARTANADCIAAMFVDNRGEETIPPSGVVFVSRSCGGEGARLHPLSGTARTTVDGSDDEMIEFEGLSGHVAITSDVGWLDMRRRGEEFPRSIWFLRVDPGWKRPTSVPRLRELSRYVSDLGCVGYDNLVFELDRTAAGLEVTWRRDGTAHVRRVGIGTAGDGAGFAPVSLWGDAPRAGDILTLTVIESDGTRTPVEPPTLVVPDLDVLAALTEQRSALREQVRAIEDSPSHGPTIAAAAGLALLVAGVWLRRRALLVAV